MQRHDAIRALEIYRKTGYQVHVNFWFLYFDFTVIAGVIFTTNPLFFSFLISIWKYFPFGCRWKGCLISMSSVRVLIWGRANFLLKSNRLGFISTPKQPVSSLFFDLKFKCWIVIEIFFPLLMWLFFHFCFGLSICSLLHHLSLQWKSMWRMLHALYLLSRMWYIHQLLQEVECFFIHSLEEFWN